MAVHATVPSGWHLQVLQPSEEGNEAPGRYPLPPSKQVQKGGAPPSPLPPAPGIAALPPELLPPTATAPPLPLGVPAPASMDALPPHASRSTPDVHQASCERRPESLLHHTPQPLPRERSALQPPLRPARAAPDRSKRTASCKSALLARRSLPHNTPFHRRRLHSPPASRTASTRRRWLSRRRRSHRRDRNPRSRCSLTRRYHPYSRAVRHCCSSRRPARSSPARHQRRHRSRSHQSRSSST